MSEKRIKIYVVLDEINAVYSPASCQILTLNLLTTTIVAPPSNASKWQMGFNSAFKGLIKLRFPWRIPEKYSNMRFHENPSNGSRVVPCGQTERGTAERTNGYDEASSRIMLFFTNAPKNDLHFRKTCCSLQIQVIES